MIGALAVLWLVGVAWTVPAPRDGFKCPDQDQNSTVVLVANPANCSTFYECDNGKEKLQVCSPDTFFSSKDHVCTYKKDSDCPNTVDFVDVLEIDEEDDKFTMSLDDGEPAQGGEAVNYTCPADEDNTTSVYYPNLQNCSTFYECSNQRAVLLVCPQRLYFNARLCVCTQPKKSGCTQPDDDDDDIVAMADGVSDILTDSDWLQMKEIPVNVHSGKCYKK